MKKLFSLILTLVCIMVFSGCGRTNGTAGTDSYLDAAYTQVTETVLSVTEETEAAGDIPDLTDGDTSEGSEDDIFVPPDETEPEEADETEPEEADETRAESPETEEPVITEEESLLPDINGTYTSKEDVALYIHTYGKLPDNFISKKDAEALGWPGGSLEPYAPGKCIGGSRFGNYEGLLPEAKGRKYTECDIDTLGASKRGAKRIVFSNDGLIYYTEDHYETFELLYGDED